MTFLNSTFPNFSYAFFFFSFAQLMQGHPQFSQLAQRSCFSVSCISREGGGWQCCQAVHPTLKGTCLFSLYSPSHINTKTCLYPASNHCMSESFNVPSYPLTNHLWVNLTFSQINDFLCISEGTKKAIHLQLWLFSSIAFWGPRLLLRQHLHLHQRVWLWKLGRQSCRTRPSFCLVFVSQACWFWLQVMKVNNYTPYSTRKEGAIYSASTRPVEWHETFEKRSWKWWQVSEVVPQPPAIQMCMQACARSLHLSLPPHLPPPPSPLHYDKTSITNWSYHCSEKEGDAGTLRSYDGLNLIKSIFESSAIWVQHVAGQTDFIHSLGYFISFPNSLPTRSFWCFGAIFFTGRKNSRHNSIFFITLYHFSVLCYLIWTTAQNRGLKQHLNFWTENCRTGQDLT